MNLSIFDAAAEAPGRPALVAGDRVYTFSELAGLASGALENLPERAAGDGETIVPAAITGAPCVPAIVYLYALFERAIPALILHPRWTEVERDEIVCPVPLSIDLHDPPMPRSARERRHDRSAPPDDERPLAILHTSGSTGRAKGVILSRKAIIASAAASSGNLGWNDDDRWLLSMPLSHAGGLSIITRSLIARRTVVLEPRFEASRIIEAIDLRKVTILSLVPAMLRRLLDHRPAWRVPAHLRAVLVGGDAVPDDLRKSAIERGVPMLATYGLTETCSQVATERYGTGEYSGSTDRTGAPLLEGIEGRIRDGMIEIRGDIVTNGYFPSGVHPSPFTNDGWLMTGDAGEIDDERRLQVFGRAGGVIISGGENVSVAEVEGTLRSIPGVKDVCVFALPSTRWGEAVCAAIVPDADKFDADRFSAAARSRLAPHKQPKQYFALKEIPRLPSGSPDRSALSRLHSLNAR